MCRAILRHCRLTFYRVYSVIVYSSQRRAIQMRAVLAIMVCIVLIGIGCSRDPYESGPSETDVRNRLATEFPAYIEIRSLDLRATENVGDKVQPMFKIRFEGEIQL